MPKRDAVLLLGDILESIRRIGEYTRGMDFQGLRKNQMVVDAVIRNCEIIGEASRNVPKEIQQEYTDIPWSRIIGFRNVAVHKYFEVDLELLWVIISEQIPTVEPLIKKALTEVAKMAGSH